jgi:NAD(P)-dependent dehydrogenase (short-subunit alcohol dehydrogenase family)
MGNGKAIAVLLARQGASVFGCGLDLAAAQATRKLIEKEGGVAEVRAQRRTPARQLFVPLTLGLQP